MSSTCSTLEPAFAAAATSRWKPHIDSASRRHLNPSGWGFYFAAPAELLRKPPGPIKQSRFLDGSWEDLVTICPSPKPLRTFYHLTYSGASLLSEAQCWCEFHFPPVYFFSATVIDWLGVERTANAPESDGHAPNYFWIKYSASNYRSAVAFFV